MQKIPPLTKDSVWKSVTVSTVSNTFDELAEGDKYWFRVASIGTRKQIAYSQEVFQYVMQRGGGNDKP